MESVFSQILQNPSVQPYLPFFFTLAIVYGLLTIVGERGGGLFGKKSVNLIISLVFAFFAAGYQPFVTFFFNYFGLILWTFVGLFFMAFFLEVIGARKGRAEGREEVPMVFGALVIILIITVGVGYVSEFKIPVVGSENLLMGVGLFLLALIFYYAFQLGQREEGPSR